MNTRQPLNQLLEADIVYVRDFAHADSMSDEQPRLRSGAFRRNRRCELSAVRLTRCDH